MKKIARLYLLVLASLMFAACVPAPAATMLPTASIPDVETPAETSAPPTAAPELQVGEVIVEWEGRDGACGTVKAGEQGMGFGLCGGPLMPGRYASEQRAEDLDYYAKTYASFDADTPAGKLSFSGEGDQQAAPAEQRMIAEWARLVYVEASGGLSGASSGLALAWRREGGIAGFCDSLEVYLTGAVFGASCQGGQPEELGRTHMDAGQLKKLFDWIDSLKPFELNQTDPAAADAMTIELVFSGAGEKEAGEAEVAALQEFAAQLYAGLEQPGTAAGAQGTPSADLEAARQALTGYFAALNDGRYGEAAGYYGGSYEILTGYNPDIPPEDYEALLDAGCRYNGLQCLKVREIVKAEQLSPTEFSLTAEFANPDGSLFQRGPCCGEDPAQSPPESQFTFTVVKRDGKFLVQELPVYVP